MQFVNLKYQIASNLLLFVDIPEQLIHPLIFLAKSLISVRLYRPIGLEGPSLYDLKASKNLAYFVPYLPICMDQKCGSFIGLLDVLGQLHFCI
jgi:hypothetical protein